MSAIIELTHFLNLALQEIRREDSRSMQQCETNQTAAHDSRDQSADPRNHFYLRMLEELVKEQIPHEDIGPATRPTR